MITFGQRLKILRKEGCLTQADIAEQLMVTVQTVSKWECDTSMPDISQIVPLASVLGVTTDCLLGVGTDEKADREKMLEQINDLGKAYNCETYENNAGYKAYELYRNYIKKYPLDYWGKFHCAQFILGFFDNSQGGQKYKIPEEEEQKLYNEGVKLLLTVINQDKDPERLIHARSLLVGFYLYKDEYTKAEAIAMDIPNIFGLRNMDMINIYDKKGEYEKCLELAEENCSWFASAYIDILWTRARRISIFGNSRKQEAIEAWRYLEKTIRLIYDRNKITGCFRNLINALCYRSNDHIAISEFDSSLAACEEIRDLTVEHYNYVKDKGGEKNELDKIKEIAQNTLKRSYFLSLGDPDNIIDNDQRFRKCREDIEDLR